MNFIISREANHFAVEVILVDLNALIPLQDDKSERKMLQCNAVLRRTILRWALFLGALPRIPMCTNRETWKQNSDLRRVGAIMRFAALLLCGCASTIDAPNKQPESADLPEGHGAVIGSILLSVPTGVLGIHKQKMIDSLKAKKYEATIRRYVVHDYGFADRIEYLSDTYRVAFEIDVAKQFVIRAPSGTYEIRNISQIITGIFGEKNTGCMIESPAFFHIHAGKTTYIGQLTIIAEFKSDEEVKMHQAFQRARGIYLIGVPEDLLNMRISATDKDKTLRNLDMDKPGAAIELDTQLMSIWGKAVWNCEPPPIQLPPGVPRRPGT